MLEKLVARIRKNRCSYFFSFLFRPSKIGRERFLSVEGGAARCTKGKEEFSVKSLDSNKDEKKETEENIVERRRVPFHPKWRTLWPIFGKKKTRQRDVYVYTRLCWLWKSYSFRGISNFTFYVGQKNISGKVFFFSKKKKIKGKRLSFNYRANNKPVAYQEQCIFSLKNKRSIFKINY